LAAKSPRRAGGVEQNWCCFLEVVRPANIQIIAEQRPRPFGYNWSHDRPLRPISPVLCASCGTAAGRPSASRPGSALHALSARFIAFAGRRDPAKAAAILHIASRNDPPLRLLLGSDAVRFVDQNDIASDHAALEKLACGIRGSVTHCAANPATLGQIPWCRTMVRWCLARELDLQRAVVLRIILQES
jgi:hypothetical protein